MKRFLIICLAIFMCLTIVACTDSGDDYYYEEYDNESLSHKIAYSIDIEIEAEDPASVKKSINDKSKALGGYIQSHTESYSSGECDYITITYCVPSNQLEELVEAIESSGELESKSVYTENITAQRASATAKKASLEESRASLEKLLEQATSASERVTLIEELSSVNTEIRSIELMLSEFDSSVEHSTITVTITEKIRPAQIIVPILVILVISAAGVTTTIVSVRISRKRKKP